jgi:hypothetical protein
MKANLKIGMEKSNAIKLLGQPKKRLELPEPCDLNVLTDKECDAFMKVGAQSIFYWRIAIDGLVIAGFDGQGKLVLNIFKKAA